MENQRSSFIHSMELENQIMNLYLHSGEIYRYNNIPEDLYQRFLESESWGRFYNQFIRNHFEFEKI